MRILVFGSRSLSWKHYDVMHRVVWHASLAIEHPLDVFLEGVTRPGGSGLDLKGLPESERLTLINGDGPPGKERGAIGADKLAVFAAMQTWVHNPRSVRWFPAEPHGQETWAQAAGRRNREMVEAKPQRAYCIHTNLDASKGSAMTADMLKQAGIQFWLVTVKPSGEVVSVEVRR